MKIIKYPKRESFAELSKRPELDRGGLEMTVVTIMEMVKKCIIIFVWIVILQQPDMEL